MTESEISFQIKKLSGSKCKAYFNEVSRTPLIGRFVLLEDHRHLVEKDLIRFVSDRNEEDYEKTGSTAYTRLYMISRFSIIKPI